MTVYEKQLTRLVEEKYGNLPPVELICKLLEIGVVDYTRCKVLAVREFVRGKMREGFRKIDAMWEATEKFSCSYEYIRKCMYYYTDVNFT